MKEQAVLQTSEAKLNFIRYHLGIDLPNLVAAFPAAAAQVET